MQPALPIPSRVPPLPPPHAPRSRRWAPHHFPTSIAGHQPGLRHHPRRCGAASWAGHGAHLQPDLPRGHCRGHCCCVQLRCRGRQDASLAGWRGSGWPGGGVEGFGGRTTDEVCRSTRPSMMRHIKLNPAQPITRRRGVEGWGQRAKGQGALQASANPHPTGVRHMPPRCVATLGARSRYPCFPGHLAAVPYRLDAVRPCP